MGINCLKRNSSEQLFLLINCPLASKCWSGLCVVWIWMFPNLAIDSQIVLPFSNICRKVKEELREFQANRYIILPKVV